MNIRTALAAILILNGLAIGNLLFAADDPQQTIAAQAQMIARQNACIDLAGVVMRQSAALEQAGQEIAALRREIEALKKKDAPPK